jgi:hypothetical protein
VRDFFNTDLFLRLHLSAISSEAAPVPRAGKISFHITSCPIILSVDMLDFTKAQANTPQSSDNLKK